MNIIIGVVILLILIIITILYRKIFSLSPTQKTALEKIKPLTPEQISNLPSVEINQIASEFYTSSHGIPQFPLLERNLTVAQYNAFYKAFSGGRVY